MLITVMVIMRKYAKLYGWMHEAFGEKEFSIDDFRAVFPSPHPGKVIHDLIRLNYLDRVKRGRYRVTAPNKFVERIVEENMKQEDILKNVMKDYAYCNNDAVTIWTQGYYWTGFTAGFKPIHIKVLERDMTGGKISSGKTMSSIQLEGSIRPCSACHMFCILREVSG
jgi:hypothetical protein